MSRIVDHALRVVLTGMHLVLTVGWFIRRPKTYGAHAIALTPEGKLILLKLRYASGWRVPGGGRSALEDSVDAALRELREEIGMISHGEARLVCDLEESTDFKRDTASQVIVRDVRYRPPRWSWEVEQIREVDPNSLPEDVSPVTVEWIEAIRELF